MSSQSGAQLTTTPIAAADRFFPLTVAHLTIAAVIAVIMVVVLIVGIRARNKRRHTTHELESRGEIHYTDSTVSEAAPEPPRPGDARAAEIAPAPTEDEAPALAPAPAPSGAGEDDLTRMKGVGPRLADKLRSLGITRFAQLAALDDSQAEALDAQLGEFKGRLARDRWIEQARLLAADDIAGYEQRFGKL